MPPSAVLSRHALRGIHFSLPMAPIMSALCSAEDNIFHNRVGGNIEISISEVPNSYAHETSEKNRKSRVFTGKF